MFNNIAKLTLLITLLTISTAACGGIKETNSKKCNIDTAHALEIRGFRLGMTQEQARSQFEALKLVPPISSVEPDWSYAIGCEANDSHPCVPRHMSEVHELDVQLTAGYVSKVSVFYKNRQGFTKHEQVVEQMSKSLSLPPAEWENIGYWMELECDNVEIHSDLFRHDYPFISISDLKAEEVIPSCNEKRGGS